MHHGALPQPICCVNLSPFGVHIGLSLDALYPIRHVDLSPLGVRADLSLGRFISSPGSRSPSTSRWLEGRGQFGRLLAFDAALARRCLWSGLLHALLRRAMSTMPRGHPVALGS